MRILYDKSQGVAIQFNQNEINVALAVLEAIYKACEAGFVKDVIEDIKVDMKPKQLPFINHHHLCQSCFRTIDERDENTMRISQNDDVKYKCRVCKPINPHRPI